MRNKKSPQANIEKRKTSFFLTGLVLAIGGAIAIINLEWTQAEAIASDWDNTFEDTEIEIQPLATKEAPKARKPVEVIKEVFVIKKDIDPVSDEPDIKLNEEDPLEGDSDIIDDSLIESIDFIEDPDDNEEIVTFISVEKYPMFADCGDLTTKDEQRLCFQKGLLSHISDNFRYPELELQMGLEEKVYVEFVITKKGEVDQVKIVRGNMDGFIKESKRLIKSLPKIKPAEQRGKPVNMKYTIPIKFQLRK